MKQKKKYLVASKPPYYQSRFTREEKKFFESLQYYEEYASMSDFEPELIHGYGQSDQTDDHKDAA
jgi:hypothetical protein